MSQIEVPDWVVEIAARVVAKNVGEDYDSLGPFTQDTIKATQRECISAALGAWVVEMGVEVRDPDGFVAMFSRDEAEQLRIPRRDDDYNGSKTQPLFALRQEKPE